MPAEEAENDVDAGVIKRSAIACVEGAPAVTPAGITSSATPRLRVQPTSDGSYSPSLPSTPSNSKSRKTASSESDFGDRDRGCNHGMVSRVELRLSHCEYRPDLRPSRSQVTPPTDSRADLVSSPVASTPTTPTPATMRSSSPSPSPASSVSIAGGLLERLKAQRAARGSAETVHPLRPIAGASESGGSTASASPKSEPTGAGVSAVLAANAPSPTEIQRLDRHSPAGLKDRPHASLEATLHRSPPRPTSGVCSAVLSSPDGEEFDHAFHPLSDVMCVTRRFRR